MPPKKKDFDESSTKPAPLRISDIVEQPAVIEVESDVEENEDNEIELLSTEKMKEKPKRRRTTRTKKDETAGEVKEEDKVKKPRAKYVRKPKVPAITAPVNDTITTTDTHNIKSALQTAADIAAKFRNGQVSITSEPTQPPSSTPLAPQPLQPLVESSSSSASASASNAPFKTSNILSLVNPEESALPPVSKFVIARPSLPPLGPDAKLPIQKSVEEAKSASSASSLKSVPSDPAKQEQKQESATVTTAGTMTKATKASSTGTIKKETKPRAKGPKKTTKKDTTTTGANTAKEVEVIPPVLTPEQQQNQALKQPKATSSLPRPKLLDVTPGTGLGSRTDSVEPEEPIISIHVPLSSKTEEPGSTQVVFNVLKMAEDKYGWKNIHPTASKFNIDDDIEDDDMEDDGEEEEKEEPVKVDGRTLQKGKPKVGQYDFEDPFIDDAELLWEEQRASTKDGFFVFYGPLIEEGKNARIEKLDGTIKRGRKRPAVGSSSGGAKKKPSFAPKHVSAPKQITPKPLVPIAPVPSAVPK